MSRIIKVATVVALVAASTTAVAGVRAAFNYPFNFSSGAAAVLVPLNSAGATQVQWNQPSNGRKVLTFSAECSVDAPNGNNFAWVDLDIIVNNVVVAPTSGSGDAFCSADNIAGFGGYTRASITVAVQGFAGANTVRIQARGNAGATGVWISDSSLVIHD